MTLEATASSGMTVNYLSNTPSVCEVAGETATFSTVGVCSITASQPGGSGYTAAIPVTESFSVQNSQTILLSNPETAVLGAGSLTIVANASSGLAVTLTAATPSMCSVSGSVLTPKAAGVCTVNASQPGNATYAAAATATASVNVLAPQSIAFPSLPIQGLGGLPFTVSATASSGLAVSFSSQSPAVCSVSGNLVTLLSLKENELKMISCCYLSLTGVKARYVPRNRNTEPRMVNAIRPEAGFGFLQASKPKYALQP